MNFVARSRKLDNVVLDKFELLLRVTLANELIRIKRNIME